jgi:UDP-N-acetylglucosamine acyltransferase
MSAPAIHPSAVVDPTARIGAGVRIGPFAVIGPEVALGDGCEVRAHAVLDGPSSFGAGCVVHSFAALGTPPQDKKWKGEHTQLVVGEGNVFRECVTVNRGTGHGGAVTRIGDHNLFMAYAHVAHDCTVGSHTVFANGATLAGHVVIEDHVGLGGMAAVGQFVRVGESAFLGANAMVSMDVAPYCLAQGDRARLFGLNVVGLRRRGFSGERLSAVEAAYRITFRSNLTLDEACAQLEAELGALSEIRHFVSFLRAGQRGLMRPGGE